MAIRNALLTFLLGALLLPAAASQAAKYDVLELPSAPTPLAAKAPLFFVGKFGSRYYAAGAMGIIIYSDDGGQTWTQAQVPVRSTLLDLTCYNDKLCWAVGHESVILHSTDGGATWVKQFDGIRYANEGLAYYEKKAEENPDNELYPILVGEMEFAKEQGADKPLFTVYFASETFGYTSGAYGMFLRTDDGGEHWYPVMENIENDNFNHIFDFAPLPQPGRFFLAGEAGLFLLGNANEGHASRVHSVPWEGSFFTDVDTADGAIVLGGLRGRMYRTADEGNTWLVVEKPSTSALVSSTRLKDNRLVFGGVGGEILVSDDNGFSFHLDPASDVTKRIFALTQGEGDTLLIAGPKGIRSVTLAPK